MSFLIIFVAIVIYICLNRLIANEFYEVAAAKGHSERKYFWYCFFFGIVGYLMVIALQNKVTPENKDFELPEI